MTLTEPQTRSRTAPDLYGTAWLNGEPYGIRRGDGDIVLVDFWSSTCVQCLSDLARMKRWQSAYGDAGLVVVGVHSPEYEFEFSRDHVEKTVREQGLGYPIVLDNKGTIRSSYGVQMLPTHMLVDRNGMVRYVLHGRRDFIEFERALQFLLREAGYNGELPSLLGFSDDPEPRPDGHDVEIKCGYVRGTIGNVQGAAPESLLVYADPLAPLPGRIYLDGPWWSGRESLRSEPGPGTPSSMRVVSYGGDLYIVARGLETDPVEVSIALDGEPLPRNLAGSDVGDLSGGRRGIPVSEPRAYHVAKDLGDRMNDIAVTSPEGRVEVFQVSILSTPDMRSIHSN